MSRFKDLTGMKFHRLTVIERASNTNAGQARWKCLCECGNQSIVASGKLLSGHTKSCGCLKNELTSNRRRKHGESGNRLYVCWQHMKRRCDSPKDKYFHNYGGRGINVCSEWESYENFRSWALSNGYDDTLTLDRIDVNGGYCPENCRWATVTEQQNNRRNNHIVEFNNEIHTLAEWSRIVGINFDVLQMRINKLKWPIEKAFTTPVRSCGRSVENKV